MSLVAGLVIVGFGLLSFNRAHLDRTASGGYGSGLSPRGRELLSIVVILAGIGTMLAAAVGY